MSELLESMKNTRAAKKTALDVLLSKPTPAPGDAERADTLVKEVRDLDARISAYAEAQQREEIALRNKTETYGPSTERLSGGSPYGSAARVTREHRGYEGSDRPDTGPSFFKDAFAAQYFGDHAAAERIARSQRAAEMEGRAVATSGFGGLIVPQHLVDEAALKARNGRVVADLCNRLPLPDDGMSLVIPREATGASVASQAAQNTAVSNTDHVVSDLTVPVNTLAGSTVASRQSLERGSAATDRLIMASLTGAYAAELDRQVIEGSAGSGEHRGILTTVGIGASSAYAAAWTVALFYKKVAAAVQAIEAAGTSVGPADAIVMHPRRWAALVAAVDSDSRPIVVPAMNGPHNAVGVNTNPGVGPDQGPGPKGYIHGLPVFTSANVPADIGSTAPEDVAIVGNFGAHGLLFEANGGVPNLLRFDQTEADKLSVHLICYGYSAFTAARQVAAFYKVGGADDAANKGQIDPALA